MYQQKTSSDSALNNSASTPRSSAELSPLCETYSQYPFEIDRGAGVFVYDTSGKEYIDFYGGHCVCCVGHSRAEVVAAIAQQAERMMFYSNLARIPIREQAAGRLVEFANNGLKKCFFCNSGGEANENALKISLKLTGRQKFVSFTGGFHGRTALAVGATDHPDWHEYMHGWMGPRTKIAPNDLSALTAVDRETAAVILEPIQSIGGVTAFDFEFLKKLRARCDEVGALLIFDEVQTGMGRTGVPFVSGHCGTLPDMMTLAKGLSNGLPVGAVVMTPEVAAGLKVGDIAATFGGGPLAMAGLMATIDCLEEDNLMSHVLDVENHVRKTFASRPWVSEVRGRGALLGVVTKDREAKLIQKALFEKGMIVGTNSNPKLVHLLPPMTIELRHIDLLAAAMESIMGATSL